MGIIEVVAAAGAAWLFGAVWYGVTGSRWMAAAGLTAETINRRNFAAYFGSFFCALLVAGMMRHVFVTSDVATLYKGVLTGFGLGLFIATPWVVTNYLFSQRPVALMVIDGAYATVGCTLMGAALVLV
jgi:hypothetical protein